jgi:hypothetical protein
VIHQNGEVSKTLRVDHGTELNQVRDRVEIVGARSTAKAECLQRNRSTTSKQIDN